MEEDKNINLIVKTEEESGDAVLSLSAIWCQAKRFFLVWILIAVVIALAALVGVSVVSDAKVSTQAMIGFHFNGIEEGKDPAGNTFDVTKIKSPAIIQNALVSLDMTSEETKVDDIRNQIQIKGVIPEDALKKITAYKDVFSVGNTNALSAVQSMLDVTYNPSQFIIEFNAGEVGLDAQEGKELLDAILTSYRQFFFETYGYNKALGSAVLAVDYKDYDYERATDVFDTTLSSAQKYINTLAKQDVSNFRSNTTGYTFADLAAAIDTLRSVDLDWLNSYITMYNVTKDRAALITYYQYKIASLTRSKEAAQQDLTAIEQSIAAYQKDTVLMFNANGTDESGNLSMTQASEAYDNMFAQKTEKQEAMSTYEKSIKYYTMRIDALNLAVEPGSEAQMKSVEENLDSLYNKITVLLEKVNATANEYYENVAFANAVNIVVPSSSTSVGRLHVAVLSSVKIIVIAEAALLLLYIMVVIIASLAKKPAAQTEADEEQKAKPDDAKKEKPEAAKDSKKDTTEKTK